MNQPSQMPSQRPALHVRDVPEHDRYEATLGDSPELAALLDYKLMDRHIALLHTEVETGFEGQGIGSRLARWVFDDARGRGLKVIPKCPFIVRWLERHPEQHDVLARPIDTPPSTPSGGLEPA